MYLPRLRARQAEMLAVRSCASSFASSRNVTPVLEPVNTPDKVFLQRLNAIADDGLSCDLVLNPSVGEMSGREQWRGVGKTYMDNGLLSRHGLAVLSNANADHAAMAQWIEAARGSGLDLPVDIIHEPDLSASLKGNTYRGVRWNVAEDRTVPSMYGLPLAGHEVVWSSDPFPAMDRNRDYVGRPESIFSTRVAGYNSSGYIGISDFATIGRAYQSGGGPAYAVVIHFTYERAGTVRLQHFCSDSNDTQDDPGGKFLEALKKLISFVDAAGIPRNEAIRDLRDLYYRQHFPGLSKVKELSIRNHLLLMQGLV